MYSLGLFVLWELYWKTSGIRFPVYSSHHSLYIVPARNLCTLPLLLELDHSLEMYVLGRFRAKPEEKIQTLSFTQSINYTHCSWCVQHLQWHNHRSFILSQNTGKEKQEEPQIIYLIFNSHGRHFEISALCDRGLSSLHTWGRIHVMQPQCLKSKQTTENPENGLRLESPHAIQCHLWGLGRKRRDPIIRKCLSTWWIEPSCAGRTGASLSLTVPHEMDSIQWPSTAHLQEEIVPGQAYQAAPRLCFRWSLLGDL